eukprot:gene15742-17329_t
MITTGLSSSSSLSSATTDRTRRKKSSLECLWKYSEQFVIRVQCPDNSTLTIIHSIKETCQNVLSNVCSRLGIRDETLFSLAIFKNNEYRVFPGHKCMGSIFPKWAIITGESLSCLKDTTCMSVEDTMIKTCKLYLRLVNYPRHVCSLHPVTLHYYFYQLRWDALMHQNLLCLDGYDDSFIQLAFLSILAVTTTTTNTTAALDRYHHHQCYQSNGLDTKAGLSNYLPQTVLESYSVDKLASLFMLCSDVMPVELSIVEAQIQFINLALQIPAVCSYLFNVDVIASGGRAGPRGLDTDRRCMASLGPNSIRVFTSKGDVIFDNSEWSQTAKWDVQEIETITITRRVISIHCEDYEKEPMKLQFIKETNARCFVRLAKDMHRLDHCVWGRDAICTCQKCDVINWPTQMQMEREAKASVQLRHSSSHFGSNKVLHMFSRNRKTRHSDLKMILMNERSSSSSI